METMHLSLWYMFILSLTFILLISSGENCTRHDVFALMHTVFCCWDKTQHNTGETIQMMQWQDFHDDDCSAYSGVLFQLRLDKEHGLQNCLNLPEWPIYIYIILQKK